MSTSTSETPVTDPALIQLNGDSEGGGEDIMMNQLTSENETATAALSAIEGESENLIIALPSLDETVTTSIDTVNTITAAKIFPDSVDVSTSSHIDILQSAINAANVIENKAATDLPPENGSAEDELRSIIDNACADKAPLSIDHLPTDVSQALQLAINAANEDGKNALIITSQDSSNEVLQLTLNPAEGTKNYNNSQEPTDVNEVLQLVINAANESRNNSASQQPADVEEVIQLAIDTEEEAKNHDNEHTPTDVNEVLQLAIANETDNEVQMEYISQENSVDINVHNAISDTNELNAVDSNIIDNPLTIDEAPAVVTSDVQPATTHESQINMIDITTSDLPQSTPDINIQIQATLNQPIIDVSTANELVYSQASIDEATANQLATMEVDGNQMVVDSEGRLAVAVADSNGQMVVDSQSHMMVDGNNQIVVSDNNQIVITQPSSIVGADGNHISITQAAVDSQGVQLALQQEQMDVSDTSQITMQQVDAIQSVNGVASSEAETITINLPTSTIQNLQLNGALALPNSPVAVLQTDYMNILDIVLNNSKLSLQGSGLDGNQAIVLAEVDRNGGEMIAVKGIDGQSISLTPEQLNALNVAAGTDGENLSIVTSEATNDVLAGINTDVNNQNKTDAALISAIPELKESIAKQTAASIVALKDDNGDDIEFEEDLDDDPFEVPANSPPLEKTEQIIDGRPEVKYKCSECGRPYVTKAALKKHLNVIHGKELETTMQKATSKCIHPGCEKIFYHRQKMIDHLKEEHGVNCVQEDLVFNSWDEFFIWKEKEEDANFVHFSKNSTHTNAPNYMLTNFTCQREGKAGYKYKGSQQKKYKDLVIGEKICPARMRARLDKPTGRVTVQYCKSHNHKLSFQDFLYRRMPDRLRNEIREKLLAGMSSEEIYKELKSTDNLRESRGERFAPSKRQFVTLINIKTIAKRMQIKETGPPKNFVLDPDPYGIQMQKLLDETYNPVLLYKDQGVNIEVGPDEIEKVITNGMDLLLIGIQTKEQKEMFVTHGHKIVFIDITEAVVSPTQYVITVKVLDEYNKGYPVAFLLSNSRDETVLFYFFREMQARVAETGLKINAVMTENSCNEYYAFRSVFGDHVKHLLCKWNLHRAWCQKIHEECAGDEALQQELYFIFVTMLEEQDLSKFESIATEFVNNYQARCPNFITFFMSNYLSQPEVWASCYRNNPFSDCDEILYSDRLNERIKKEMKNNHKVKSLDDILDLVLKFEHEDYFNRGLNLMLNPPEGDLVLSEHALGMKIKNASVVENYTADNRWLVKTTKRDPSDLQNIKEESYIVTWKADICEKDFCRERCLKLTCFGLCGHLYHCSCDVTTVTPCSHIHKVHSLRIGVSQYQNEEREAKEGEEMTVNKVTIDNDNVLISAEEKDEGKLNLINQVNSSSVEQDNRTREEKMKKIKMDLVKMYKFLDSDNIQKYSLDFIDAGLKKVIDECKIIDSIGQSKSIESFEGKKKSTVEDIQDFEMLVNLTKRKKVMGTSVPVIVEIEPNPATYNTFRKRVTGDSAETPEDRMLKLSKSKNITVNIESDDKFRKNQTQQVTSTPGIIVAKEIERALTTATTTKTKEVEEIVVPDEEEEVVMQTDPNDTEWTPRQSSRKRKSTHKAAGNKKKSIKIEKSEKVVKEQAVVVSNNIPALESIPDPLKNIVSNGSLSLNMTQIKILDIHITQSEKEKCQAFSPGWDFNTTPDVIIDSYFYVLSQKYNILSLTIAQMQSLCNNEPHITRFWDPEEIDGEKSSSYIFVPWKNPRNYYSLYVIDLKNHCITYLDARNSTQEDDPNDATQVSKDEVMRMVTRAHTTLIGLMITEIPFDSTRIKQLTWPLTIDTDIELDSKDPNLRCMWYAHRLCNNTTLTDKTLTMDNYRRVIYDNVVGKCLQHIIADKVNYCPLCNSSEGDNMIECSRCVQVYHLTCLQNCNLESGVFVCI